MIPEALRSRIGQAFNILTFLFVGGLLVVLGYRITPPGGVSNLRARFAATEAPAFGDANLVLITLDGLRSDRVGFRGAGVRSRTPNLDRLAAEAFRFEQTITPAPASFAAHAALMTGRFPGPGDGGSRVAGSLAASRPTLARILRAEGFRTAAFVGSGAVGRISGLAQGFDHFDEPEAEGRPATIRFLVERSAAQVVGAARAWVDENFRHRFFLWVQLCDPLAPHRPPSSRNRRAASGYDGEVSYADAELGRLLERLAALGALRNTIVVVTASYGVALGDHAAWPSGLGLYDSTILVPALLRLPGEAARDRSIPEQVRLIDFTPTLLDLLRVAAPPGIEGRVLTPLLDPGGDLRALPAVTQSVLLEEFLGGPRVRALRWGGWKYIEGGGRELYDLGRDPGETRDLSGSQSGRTAEMRQMLAGLAGPGVEDDAAAAVSAAAAQRLEEGLVALRAGEGSRAARALEDLVKPDAAPAALLALLGAARRLEDRPGEALRLYEQALGSGEDADRPVPEGGLLGLLQAEVGACRWLMGETEGAIASYRLAVASLPDDLETRVALASILLESGQASEAVEEFHGALAGSPEEPRVLAGLGRAYLAVGSPAAAVRPLQEAIRGAPAVAKNYFDLARAYEALERQADAARAYQEYADRASGTDAIDREEALQRIRSLGGSPRRR